MIWVFDMDGCLVDSRKAVEEAYRAAGHALPQDAWGKSADEWKCPQQVHIDKNRLYPSYLAKHGRRLHAAGLIEIVGGTILTSASPDAVAVVKKFLGIDSVCIGSRCNADKKIKILLEMDTSIIYVDDDRDFGMRAMRDVPRLKFVHTLQHEGMYQVHAAGRGTQRWTMSDWVPDMAVV